MAKALKYMINPRILLRAIYLRPPVFSTSVSDMKYALNCPSMLLPDII